MAELAILVPVLNRPQNVRPLLDSIGATVEATVLFVADPDDRDEIAALEAEGAKFITQPGNYARKVNRAVCETSEPLLFFGADDLSFRPGWFEAAKAQLDPAEVVGVNDLIDRKREHTTHFLVTRAYTKRSTIDGQDGPLCTRYAHNCVDDELIATATKRRVYAYAPDSHVQHLHPDAGTAPSDAVYRKGRASIRRDKQLYARRVRRWM